MHKNQTLLPYKTDRLLEKHSYWRRKKNFCQQKRLKKCHCNSYLEYLN